MRNDNFPPNASGFRTGRLARVHAHDFVLYQSPNNTLSTSSIACCLVIGRELAFSTNQRNCLCFRPKPIRMRKTADIQSSLNITSYSGNMAHRNHTFPILRYATNGKNVSTIGKYEYRFVTCSAKRNMISLLGYSPTVCRGDRIHNLSSAVSKES